MTAKTIESVIYKRLKDNLSGVNIFYEKAPPDVRLEKNYPTVLLSVEKFEDPIHGVAGLLTVEVITSQEKPAPETFESPIKKLLSGTFFKAAEIFLLKWQRSEAFEERAAERMELICGMQMTFEIYEFPRVAISDADPLEAMRLWAQDFEEKLFIVGLTDFEDFFEPTRHKPAVHFSLERTKLVRQMAAAVFCEATIRCHVFAPTLPARIGWLSAIEHSLFFVKRVYLPDSSPMRLLDSTIDFAANEITGQLQLVFEFGLPRRFVTTHGMRCRLVGE